MAKIRYSQCYRVLAIIFLLTGHRRYSTAQLAVKFNVIPKTIRRDLVFIETILKLPIIKYTDNDLNANTEVQAWHYCTFYRIDKIWLRNYFNFELMS